MEAEEDDPVVEVVGMTQLLDGGHRKFYELPDRAANVLPESDKPMTKTTSAALFSYIENNIIGKDEVFSGPYGLRKVVYCDYTASGKSLSFLEDFIRAKVLPIYGNTHTTTTVTSLQTTLFRHEARDIIRHAVNATDDDAVLFVGSGCTAAVHKLICVLNPPEPPIVFVGPYEHHSNLLPWREIATRVIRIAETDDGLVDIHHLETELKQWRGSGRQLIGCFAAASNISGIITDTDTMTVLLHKYGALAFWDYATAAPYVPIDMNPVSANGGSLACKDAVFLSVHKFVGGVQTPGLLVAKKKLFSNSVPANCGGGTVFFVRRKAHRYLHDIEVREEGGTPAIVESIRAGLVFSLKEDIGPPNILEREHKLCKSAFEFWAPLKNLVILGSRTVPRLPIFSFLIRHEGSGRFLHYNFVCAVLNDLFGIQARGGCACAGPYAEDLLGIDEELAEKFEHLLLADRHVDKQFSERETLRPGFSRLNLAFFLNDTTISFILQAVKMTVEHGWKLLPQYNFNPRTGEWRHRNHMVFKDRRWLGHISYKSGKMVYPEPTFKTTGPLPKDLQECLNEATKFFSNAATARVQLGEQAVQFDDYTERMRWFLLPSEAWLWLQDPARAAAYAKTAPPVPFQPLEYPRKKKSVTRLSKVESREEVTALVNKMRQQRISSSDLVKMAVSQSGGMVDCSTCGFLRSISSEHAEATVSDSAIPESARARLAGHAEEKDSGEGGEEDDMTTSSSQDEEEEVETPKTKSSHPHRWHAPPKNIIKPALEALQKYTMIQDGDRVLVCLSGGKDSLSLVHLIKQYQHYCKTKGINFEFGCVTVDPDSKSYDPRPLKPYLAKLGVPYFYEEQSIMDAAQNLPYECASICSFCSRMKRGRIYACARRERYNVLALGQHLDDLAESFLMSAFHNGILRTMKAHYTVQEGDLRVIRPFVFVRERDLKAFAQQKHLPVIFENCPACFEAPKERQRIKQLLAAQEQQHPRLFQSILTAIRPILGINKTGVNLKSLVRQLSCVMTRKEDEDDLITTGAGAN